MNPIAALIQKVRDFANEVQRGYQLFNSGAPPPGGREPKYPAEAEQQK